MQAYELEARSNGEWESIGAGEFENFSEASKALDDIDWPRDDLRIKPCGEIDWDEIVTCKCGGKCIAHEGNVICNTCGAEQ